MNKVAISAGLVQVMVATHTLAWAAKEKSGDSADSMALTLFVVLAIPYFIPSIIAAIRKKDNQIAIFALNLFLGWSVIGWVVALVWAVAKDKQPQTIIINNGPGNTPNQ
jgi:hypothetical protein